MAHGDLHPGNILKGSDGYCLLDLGCMDHEQRIADLAIFLSMSCTDYENVAKTRELYEAALESYGKQIQLTPAERSALPVLIQANYAMFALRTAELLRDESDNPEVKSFYKKGIRGLEFARSHPDIFV